MNGEEYEKTYFDEYTNEEINFKDAFIRLDNSIKEMLDNFKEYVFHQGAEQEFTIGLANQIDQQDSEFMIQTTERVIAYNMNKKQEYFMFYVESRMKSNYYKDIMTLLKDNDIKGL